MLQALVLADLSFSLRVSLLMTQAYIEDLQEEALYWEGMELSRISLPAHLTSFRPYSDADKARERLGNGS